MPEIPQPGPNQVVMFDADLNGNGKTYRFAAIRIQGAGWYLTNAMAAIDRSFTWQEICNLAGDQPIHLCLSWRTVQSVLAKTPTTTP